MKRAIAMAMIASTLLAGLSTAVAAEGHGKAKADNAAAEEAARSMDVPYLAVPVVRNGQLVNYLFVSVRVDIAPGVDLWRTRERAHFLRDVMVRASHHNMLADANNNAALNEARAIEVYRAAAIQVLGARAVSGVRILSSYSNRNS